jgi:hypothetical protein
MKVNQHWILALVVIGCLPLASCKKMEAEAEEGEQTAAKVEHMEEKTPDQPSRITLTDDAHQRLDIQTAAVQDLDVNGKKQRVMPFSALLYDPEGETWTFMNTEPLTYVRQRIKVDRIEGDKAILAQGPAAGTKVVTVGAAELYGSEEEFEEE